MGFNSSMTTTKKCVLTSPTSPSPQQPQAHSPALSALHTSSLASGSLASCLVTSSPFQSSPSLSLIKSEPSSLDLFKPFEYTSDMHGDLRRIDSEASNELGNNEDTTSLPATSVLVPESSPRVHKGKTWVVFYGNVPGIYHNL